MSKILRWAFFVAVLVFFTVLLIFISACDAPEIVTPRQSPSFSPIPVETYVSPLAVELPVRRAGAFCSPNGSKAKTASGSPMTCMQRLGEEQPRWRID